MTSDDSIRSIQNNATSSTNSGEEKFKCTSTNVYENRSFVGDTWMNVVFQNVIHSLAISYFLFRICFISCIIIMSQWKCVETIFVHICFSLFCHINLSFDKSKWIVVSVSSLLLFLCYSTCSTQVFWFQTPVKVNCVKNKMNENDVFMDEIWFIFIIWKKTREKNVNDFVNWSGFFWSAD